MWEHKVAFNCIKEWFPLANTTNCPPLFEEVGGEGIEVDAQSPVWDASLGIEVDEYGDDDRQSVTPTENARVVKRMLYQHMGELRSWTRKEKWHFLPTIFS